MVNIDRYSPHKNLSGVFNNLKLFNLNNLNFGLETQKAENH